MSFFHWLTASFSEKKIYLQCLQLGLKQCLLKKHGFSQKQSIKLTKKILQTDVKYRIAMKQSHFSNDKLLVFQKKQFTCNLTNLAYNSVY